MNRFTCVVTGKRKCMWSRWCTSARPSMGRRGLPLRKRLLRTPLVRSQLIPTRFTRRSSKLTSDCCFEVVIACYMSLGNSSLLRFPFSRTRRSSVGCFANVPSGKAGDLTVTNSCTNGDVRVFIWTFVARHPVHKAAETSSHPHCGVCSS